MLHLIVKAVLSGLLVAVCRLTMIRARRGSTLVRDRARGCSGLTLPHEPLFGIVAYASDAR